MKTKHTKGNWVINYTAGFIWNQDDGSRIVEFENPTIIDHIFNQVERRANAKLIAAAPELLEALNSIVIYEGDKAEFHNINDKSLVKILKAIKKATE